MKFKNPIKMHTIGSVLSLPQKVDGKMVLLKIPHTAVGRCKETTTK